MKLLRNDNRAGGICIRGRLLCHFNFRLDRCHVFPLSLFPLKRRMSIPGAIGKNMQMIRFAGIPCNLIAISQERSIRQAGPVDAVCAFGCSYLLVPLNRGASKANVNQFSQPKEAPSSPLHQ